MRWRNHRGSTWRHDRLCIKTFLQDALDGDIGWLTKLDGTLAGSFQAAVAVVFTQAQQTAHRAQAIYRRILQQEGSNLAGGAADSGGGMATFITVQTQPAALCGGRWSGWVCRSPAVCARSWVASGSCVRVKRVTNWALPRTRTLVPFAMRNGTE